MKKTAFCLLILLLSSSVIYADSNSTNDEEEKNATTIDASLMPDSEMVNEAEKYKKEILEHQDTVDAIKSLAQDQQVQEIMKDPELMKAVQTEDYKTLMTNEKFINLLNNPKIQEISKKVTEKK
ncbi:MAG: hypothetical protein NTZ63_03075 [Candidatus Omnitrophica bacterium]|nr:hypothetical protein [Candidatus Omnitrophota bacterium]